MSFSSPVQPLAGLRVLDLSRVLAGPMCAMALADLGADVIKVEHPSRGDDTRDWGVRVGTLNTSYFNSANRNKRSVTIDLQSSEGVRIATELAMQSDVVIENFKVGGADKLGLGYAQLSALNPRLVYCTISGYSRMTAEAERPGYDLLVQGEAGIMAMNGEAGQGPLKFGVAAVDMFTGMYAGQAILAALYERHATGRGRHVQMALYDSGLMITSYYGMEALLREAIRRSSAMRIPRSFPMACSMPPTVRWSSPWATTGSSCASASRSWAGPNGRPTNALPPTPPARRTARCCCRWCARRCALSAGANCSPSWARPRFPAARCSACTRR